MGKAEEGGKAREAVEVLGGSGDQIWWAVQVFGLEAFLLISRNVEIRQKSRDRSSLQPELSKFESNHIVGNGWKTQCNESVQCIYKDLH